LNRAKNNTLKHLKFNRFGYISKILRNARFSIKNKAIHEDSLTVCYNISSKKYAMINTSKII
jgi:hypothetical protein